MSHKRQLEINEFFKPREKKRKQEKGFEPIISQKKPVLTLVNSSSASTLAKQSSASIYDSFGINIDKLFVNIKMDTDFKIHNFFTPFMLSNMLFKIGLRSKKEKTGENHSCAPINNLLFPDILFQSAKEPSLIVSGDVTHHSEKNQSCHSFNTGDFLQSFNLPLYYMSSIINEKLKPDLFIKATSLNSIEFFRLEAKEKENDFKNDFLKIVMCATRQCLLLVDVLQRETGYIYPIMAPSVGNAGAFYRVSLTCVLPPCLIYYLSLLKKRNYTPQNSLHIDNILKSIKDKVPKETNSCENGTEHNEDEQREEQERKNLESMIQVLETFFPKDFRNRDISLETTSIFGKYKLKYKEDMQFRGLNVKSDDDLKQLCFVSFVFSKYIIELYNRVLFEMNMKDKTFDIPKELKDIKTDGLDILNYRFKVKVENERSTVYLVEKFMDNQWKPYEVIKEFKEKPCFVKEVNYNIFVTNLKSLSSLREIVVSSFAYECPVGESEEKMLQFLYFSCLALDNLHSQDLVHGDIKPQHILTLDTKVGLIDLEFSTRNGDSIIGWTHGFHPPEFENDTQKTASTAADIYSLGLSILQLTVRTKDQMEDKELGDKLTMDIRQNIPIYLVKILNANLRNILEGMLKENSDERIQEAADVMEELKKCQELSSLINH